MRILIAASLLITTSSIRGYAQLAEYDVADSAKQAAMIDYYLQKQDYQNHISNYISFVRQFNLDESPYAKNTHAWHVFLYATQPEHLKLAEEWIIKAHRTEVSNPFFLDTYANILYKQGKVQEAIKLQTWAVWVGQMHQALVANLFKMKACIPTWKYPVDTTTKRKDKSDLAIWTEIGKQFNRTTDSLVWLARLKESKGAPDKRRYSRDVVRYVEEFSSKREPQQLNMYAWEVFQYSDSKDDLKKALGWSKRSLRDEQDLLHYAFIDTYANLLYKLGNEKQAIEWQVKAYELCPGVKKTSYYATLSKMKNGEKTWD
jgi:hypothetical protein